MEFIWQPFYEHLNATAQIYTYAMYHHYCFFNDLWWDNNWFDDDPVVTNPELETFNADYKVIRVLGSIYESLDIYQGDHIMMN